MSKRYNDSFCNQNIIMESDANDINSLKEKIYQKAIIEIDRAEYEKHIRTLFGRPILDYAKTLVINLPGPCFSNCRYCIDKNLRKHICKYDDFLEICQHVLKEKVFQEVSITGGSLPSFYFNKLIDMILNFMPDVKITWNTNGANIDNSYNIYPIKYINLHRNAADDDVNRKIFSCTAPIISISDFKSIAEERLYLRITVDKNFDLDEYVRFKNPLYLNRLLPLTAESEKKFNEVLSLIKITEDNDIRRRNHYINGVYKDIPIRLCLGDYMSKHIPGRYPMWLNVVIIHRSGIVTGSWYEDDKLLYKKK